MDLRAVDIFSGAGGLAKGVALAGFDTIGGYDFDSASCATLRRNLAERKSAAAFEVLEADISGVEFSRHQDQIALLSGGPPCQPFSVGGKHVAQGDMRDQFPQAVRAVREIRPKAFMFENVAGLMRPRFRPYFEYIRLQLTHPEIGQDEAENWEDHFYRLQEYHTEGDRSGLHYRVLVSCVNAADYGVPQQRSRVFFVGFQQGLGARWHFPQPTHSKAALLNEQTSGRYWERHKVHSGYHLHSLAMIESQMLFDEAGECLPWMTTRDAITDLVTPVKHAASSGDPMHYLKLGARAYKGHSGSSLDLPAKTLKAGVHGVPGGENMFRNDAGELRYFTLRECARLQTFPDSYQFSGTWTAAMKQLGNAVPVKLAEPIASSILVALGK